MNVQDFMEGLAGEQKAIVSYLHQRLNNEFDLEAKIHWSIPTYYRRSLICYLNPIKSNGIELAFFRGSLLSNSQGILDRKKRKLVAGIDLYELKHVDQLPIDEIIHEAIILDDINGKSNS